MKQSVASVVEALQQLNDAAGSTSRDVIKFMTSTSDLVPADIKKSILLALKSNQIERANDNRCRLLLSELNLNTNACGGSVKKESVKKAPAKEEPAKEEPAKEEPAKEEPAKEKPVEEKGVKCSGGQQHVKFKAKNKVVEFCARKSHKSRSKSAPKKSKKPKSGSKSAAKKSKKTKSGSKSAPKKSKKTKSGSKSSPKKTKGKKSAGKKKSKSKPKKSGGKPKSTCGCRRYIW